jgi:hypothetical protein
MKPTTTEAPKQDAAHWRYPSHHREQHERSGADTTTAPPGDSVSEAQARAAGRGVKPAPLQEGPPFRRRRRRRERTVAAEMSWGWSPP